MALEFEEFNELKNAVLDRVAKNLIDSNRNNDLENYLRTIKCDDLLSPYNTSYAYNAKIIVIGDSSIKEDDMKKIAKSIGVNPNRLELHLDYDKITNFDINKLRNNFNYSDVIFGPCPHKMEGIEGYSSAIAMIKHNSVEFPKLNIASSANSLKFTKSSFEQCLKNTQYYLNEIDNFF